MRDYPIQGEVWKHFKGDLYSIQGTALHTETNELLVLYTCIKSKDISKYGIVYARPVSMFLSPVQKEKYPNCELDYRFSKVDTEL